MAGEIEKMLSQRAKIDYSAIEQPVRDLCRALNEFPGITTIGSCGGHETPNDWQEPLGSWFVTFHVSLIRGGWKSLMQIAGVELEYATGDRHLNSRIVVSVHTTGIAVTSRMAMFFNIRGDQVNADDVALLLQKIRTGQIKPIYQQSWEW